MDARTALWRSAGRPLARDIAKGAADRADDTVDVLSWRTGGGAGGQRHEGKQKGDKVFHVDIDRKQKGSVTNRAAVAFSVKVSVVTRIPENGLFDSNRNRSCV